MKKLLALVMVISSIALSAQVYADSEGPEVRVNGQLVESETPAVIVNDRTLIPMRDIFSSLGAAVGWNDYKRKAVAVKGSNIVEIPIDSNIIYKNGEPLEIDVPAMIINDRTMIPLRAVSEAFGCGVEWESGIISVTADVSHDPVLEDFLHNEFENMEISIRDDNGGSFSDTPSYFTARNKIKSYIFVDIDSDGEEELVINSEPDVKAPELNWWEAPVHCLSIWDHIEEGVINLYAKESVPHRMAYKPFIAVSDGKLCLMEYYHYGSSGCQWDERRSFSISDGKAEKIREIVFDEEFDCMSEEEYIKRAAMDDLIADAAFVEHFVEGGENWVKIVFSGGLRYIIDGAEYGREEALQALDEFDRNYAVIDNWVSVWMDKLGREE